MIFLLFSDHARTRRVVECAIGVLKNRWQCLKSGMRVREPLFACKVIKSCTALHNYLIERRAGEDPYLDEEAPLVAEEVQIFEENEIVDDNMDIDSEEE
jgi:hypothetical protein